MRNLSTEKKVYGYFLSFITIFFLLFLKFQTQIINFAGEKLFLTYHKNNLATKILELLPEKKKNFMTYFFLGRIYFVDNSLALSIENYNKSINLNPNFKEAYYGRGLTYGFASPVFYTNAEDDFKKYIKIDNNDYTLTGHHAYGAWAGYNDLAWIYFLEGNSDDSEKPAIAGLQITQYNPWLSNILGVAQLEKHDCKNATINLENAKILLQNINKDQFGEAYSGDNPDFWEIGKQEMQNTISKNLDLCKENTSFPQK